MGTVCRLFLPKDLKIHGIARKHGIALTIPTKQDIRLPKSKKSKKDIEKEAIMDASSNTHNAVLDMLATSSSHDSGSDPKGENPVVKPTPPRCSCTFEIGLQGQTSFLNRIHCG